MAWHSKWRLANYRWPKAIPSPWLVTFEIFSLQIEKASVSSWQFPQDEREDRIATWKERVALSGIARSRARFPI